MKLEIKDLHVFIDGKQILKGISLVVNPGEVHALMGPNGSGKSTLSYVLAGHPKYKVEKGDVLVDGKSILALKPDERAKLGLFLAFQHPLELHGVGLSKFLFTLAKIKDKNLSMLAFKKQLDANLSLLGVDKSFIDRDVNAGFSGGEKKRAEVLQLLTLQPQLAVLDEMDSGLDVDSMQLLSSAINALRGPEFSVLVITHYQRLLNYLKPDFVHVVVDGKIVASGNAQLALDVEKKGYQKLVTV
jgi:Fe-S cluster assembly ATP-binding protein